MSTASPRPIEFAVEGRGNASHLSTETVRVTNGPSTTTSSSSSSSQPRSLQNRTTSATSLSVAVPSPSKTKLSSSTTRERMGSSGPEMKDMSTLSTSSSPPKSMMARSHSRSDMVQSASNLPTLAPQARVATTVTKRMLSLDDDDEKSSATISKDSDEESEALDSLSALDDISHSSSRPNSARRGSALPMISESDVESSYDTASRTRHSSRRRSSTRNSPRSPIRSFDLGYSSESTSREDTPSHSHRVFTSSSTGPISPTTGHREASRSDSGNSESLRIPRRRTHSERRREHSSEQRSIPESSQDDSQEPSSDGSSVDLMPRRSTTELNLAVPSKRSTSESTRKKSKRPSKREMLALNGVWAYERENKMQIFGGTTSKIIGKLLDLLVTSPDREHIYFLVHIFLHGARQFYNAAELLSVLLKYWDLKGEYQDPCGGSLDVVRSSIIFFLAAWWEKRFAADFGSEADSAKPTMEKFIRKLPEQYAGPLSAKLKRHVSTESAIPTMVFIKPLTSSAPSKLSLLDLKPAILAGQWTLLDMRNFQAISVGEFYSSSTDGRPEWTRMLERGDKLTKWLAMSIVQQTSNASYRVKALKRTIHLALKFLEHNNFHGLMCTWGALNTNVVHRLSKTFKKLPRSALDVHKSLQEKLSEANNFANLRWSIHKQRTTGTPLIPWFELTAKNRNMLDEYDDLISPAGKKVTNDNRDEVLYSFSKFAKFAEQIEEFMSCQHNNRLLDLHSTSTHTSEVVIQNWLNNDLQNVSEEELWKLSLQCEPQEEASPTNS